MLVGLCISWGSPRNRTNRMSVFTDIFTCVCKTIHYMKLNHMIMKAEKSRPRVADDIVPANSLV